MAVFHHSVPLKSVALSTVSATYRSSSDNILFSGAE